MPIERVSAQNAVILLLDNYDSFVHNLARYFRRLDCQTRIVRSDQIDAAGCRRLNPRAIVVSPGPKRPEEAGCSIEVIRELSEQIPILGVCLGHQAIGLAFGGLVLRCGPVHGMASEISHNGSGIFKNCPSPMNVARYHSLAIDPDNLPDQLEVTAVTDDGVIMGVRHRDRPVFGMQFHPESVLTEHGLDTLSNFVSIVSGCSVSTSPPATTRVAASRSTASGATASGATASGATASGATASGATASGATASGATASGATASGATASGATASGATASGATASGATTS